MTQLHLCLLQGRCLVPQFDICLLQWEVLCVTVGPLLQREVLANIAASLLDASQVLGPW